MREREENILHRKLQRLNSKTFRQSKLESNKNLSSNKQYNIIFYKLMRIDASVKLNVFTISAV